MTGQFITIEGSEGMGKSSVIKTICDYLSAHDIDYVLTREPGGSPMGESIRTLLLANHEESMAPLTEALLFFAGRQQNINAVILPALQAGKWVISDRFTDSSLAYQGGGRGVPMSDLLQLQRWVQGELSPNLTLLLDAPVEVGLSRIASREQDRIEAESIAFFARVRDVYQQLASEHPERYRVIPADQAEEQVNAAVIEQLDRVRVSP